MSKLPYLRPVTKEISPGNADEHWARNTGLTQLIFSFQVKSCFPEKLQLETPKHKLLKANSRGSHPPSSYLVCWGGFLWGRWCEGWFYAQLTAWAAWRNRRSPAPPDWRSISHFLRRSSLWVCFLWQPQHREGRGWGKGRQLGFGLEGIAPWAQSWSLWRQQGIVHCIFS